MLLNSFGSPVINEKSPPSPAVDALSAIRFSALPRAPSVLSKPKITRGTPKTSSPSLPPAPKHRKRIVEQWPVAMQYKDVLECKTPLERSLGYARKINELAMCDCGLVRECPPQWLSSQETLPGVSKSHGQNDSPPAYSSHSNIHKSPRNVKAER